MEFYDKELCKLYSSPSVGMVGSQGRCDLPGYVDHMVETKYVHTLMVRKFFLEGGLLEVKDGT
jgi:hypothetical protein